MQFKELCILGIMSVMSSVGLYYLIILVCTSGLVVSAFPSSIYVYNLLPMMLNDRQSATTKSKPNSGSHSWQTTIRDQD